MGKALYRQYRSTSFDEVIGQDHITTTLKNSLKNNKVAHGYLLTGPHGTGKTSVARIFAHEVNNLPYAPNQTHIDIIEIDAASNRRIDEIRELRDKVQIAPTSSKYKVYIIDEVHMLTREAFNALLKTLEEPPDHVIFILATTEIHKLPDTIVSRCITFNFKPIDDVAIAKHLKYIAKNEKIKISDSALQTLSRHANGSFRDSISMLDQMKGLKNETLESVDIEMALGLAPGQSLDNILNSMFEADLLKLTKSLANAYSYGATPDKLSSQLASSLREILVNDSGDTSLNRKQLILELLNKLIDVPGKHNPRASLEIALISTSLDFSKQNPTKNDNEKTSEVDHAERIDDSKLPPKDMPNTEVKADSAKDQAKQSEKKSSNTKVTVETELDWQAVLNELKSKNNTLYGMARMAIVSNDGQTLTLSFKFPFHYKQMKQAKNLDLVNSILDKLGHGNLGITVLQTTVLADENPAINKVEVTKNPDLKNINDIFGGSEVLES